MLTRKRIAMAIGALCLSAGAVFFGHALFGERCPLDRPCVATSVYEVREFRLLFSWTPSLATTADGKLIVLGGDTTKSDWTGTPLISGRLFDPDTGEARELYELGMRYPPKDTILSPDSQQMAIYCPTPIFPPICLNEHSSGMLINLANGTVVEEFEGEPKTAAELFGLPDTFTDQSRIVPGTDLFVHAIKPHGDIVFSSIDDGREQHRISLQDVPHPLVFARVEPSPDGTKLAVLQHYRGGPDYLSVIERADGRVLANFQIAGGTNCVRWADDNSRLVTVRGLFRGTHISEFSVFDLRS